MTIFVAAWSLWTCNTSRFAAYLSTSMVWMLRFRTNLFSVSSFNSSYPIFRFKVWSLDGPSTVVASSLAVYCLKIRNWLITVQMSYTLLRLPSNNAMERRTVNIFRRPPFIGITTKEAWACTMSPTRNICGSQVMYLEVQNKCQL